MRSLLLPSLLLLATSSCQLLSGGNDWVELWTDDDSAGWEMAGPGQFRIEDDYMVAEGGMGMYWYTLDSYADFTLSLEWRVEDASNNSGVFVRFPNPGDDPWVAINDGYELQICDTAEAKHNTGSVYSIKGSTHIPTKPVGEWNHYEITVIGQRYTIRVNGELVNEFVGERGTEGYVGIQNHDDGSPVAFRNIRVRDLR